MPPPPQVIEAPPAARAEIDLTPKGVLPSKPQGVPPSPDGGEGLKKAMRLSPEAQKMMDERKGKQTPPPPAAKPGEAPTGPKFLHTPEPDEPIVAAPPVADPNRPPAATEPLATKDPKDIEAFRTMRHERDAAVKALADRQPNADMIKEIEKRDAIIERLSLVESPRFKAQFEEPIAQAEKEYAELAKQWGVNDDTMKAAMAATTMKDRAEALSGAEPEAKSMLLSSLRNMDAARSKRGSALDNWKGTREQMDQQQEVQLLQRREQIGNVVLSGMRENGVTLLTPIDGNEKWNAQAAQFEARIRQVIGSQNPVEQGAYIAHGVLYDVVQEAYQYERERRVKAENELKARVGIQPRPNGGGDTPAPTGNTDHSKPMTADQMAAAMAARYQNA